MAGYPVYPSPSRPFKEEKKRKKRKVSAFQEAIKLEEEAAEAAAERPRPLKSLGFFSQ